jgi:hypothetical protein
MKKSDKFKNMTRRELAEYIWDYYKLHIITAVIVLFMISGLVNTFIVNPAKHTYIGVAVCGEFANRESMDALRALFTGALVPEDRQNRWETLAENFFTDLNPQASMAMSSRFAAFMMMGELDILIASRETFDDMILQEVLLPLDDLLPPELAALAFMGSHGDQHGDQPGIYGIDITGGRALVDCGVTLDRPAAGIAATSKRPELALEGLKILVR